MNTPVNPVDDEEMGGERDERPPAVRRFLIGAAARGVQSAQDALDRTGRDAHYDDQDNDDDQEAGDRHEAGGELGAEAPEVDADPEAAPEVVPAPPLPHIAPRPRAKGAKHPPVATRAQVERHALEQHVNYASWCTHCVQASALARQHPLVAGASPGVPTVSADFCFMKGRDAEAGDGIPVLVMRESQTRSLFSHACAGKSTSREGYSAYIIEKCVEDIDSVQKDVHLKSDQEPAMLAFQARVQQARKSRTTLTNSPKGDHQENCRAEKAVQACQNMAWRMRLAIESHIGVRIPHKRPVLIWLIEWVGGAHNRFRAGQDDGKTPQERAGWQSQSLVQEFGEVVQFIPFRSESRADKFDAKFREGIWLGLDSRTDEGIVGTRYGVYRTSTIKSVPEDQRWDVVKVLSVVGLPWDPTPTVDADDGARLPNPDAVEAEVVPKDPEVPESIVRKMYIRKTDIEEHGQTPGCLGCKSAMLGKAPQSHSTVCRDRIEAIIRQTDAGKARMGRADDRMTEAVVRELEELGSASS